MTKNIQERVAALSSVEEPERESYTGMDNLLFEKAYTHMNDILKKFPNALHGSAAASAEEVITEEAVNPKKLFTTKKSHLMAMIAFLNGCYEALASEGEKKAELTEDPSNAVYQWSLMSSPQLTNSASAATEEVRRQEISLASSEAMSTPLMSTSSISSVMTSGKKSLPELLQLIGVADEAALCALSEEDFKRLLTTISSCRSRTQLISIRSKYNFKIKKQKEEAEAEVQARQQQFTVAWEEALKQARFIGKDLAIPQTEDSFDSEGNSIQYHIWTGPMKLVFENTEAIKECLDRFPDMQTRAHIFSIPVSNDDKSMKTS